MAGLADAAGCDPAAARAAVDELKYLGLEIEPLPDDRCRLAASIDLLDRAAILAGLAPAVAAAADVVVHAAADSSNDILLAEPPPDAGRLSACVVEYQHGGRGRRGHSWIAPPGGSLCLSVAWHFATLPPDLSALSLAVGVAARRAVEETTNVAVGVKWPNDLAVDRRKLGGILVELRSDCEGTHVVAGMGVNVRIAAERLAVVSDWPQGAIDLATATRGRPVDRNGLAAALINELHSMFSVFEVRGFAPFIAEWSRAHVLDDAPCLLKDDTTERHGTVRGVDADGALLFETGGELRRVLVGEVSLRPRA